MLSANLTIMDELSDALASAMPDLTVRALEVVVNSEALTLSAGPRIECGGESVEADYAAHIAPVCLEDSGPRIWAIRLTDASWSTVLFVPDAADVREKLLAASALSQLRSLMQDRATVEPGGFRASDAAEASSDAFVSWRAGGHPGAGAASHAEHAQAAVAGEEAATLIEHAAASASASSPAGAVPFRVGDGLLPAIREVLTGTAAAVVVVVDMDDEVMRVAAMRPAAEPLGRADVLGLAPVAEPCFVILSRAALLAGAGADAAAAAALPAPKAGTPPGCALVYSCPDAAPVRSRMTHSTAKGTLVQQCKFEAGVEFAALLEVSSSAELGEDLARMLAAEQADAAAAGSVTLATGAAEGFAKPSRPGRRRRK